MGAPKQEAGGDADDADESFDLKNYDITYDEALAGSSSDDDAAKTSAAAAAAAVESAAGVANAAITDHLGKAQKKTMDMYLQLAPPPPPPCSASLSSPPSLPLQVVIPAAAAIAGRCR
jgi:hypothetical protein